MGDSIVLGRIFGIRVGINWSWLVIAALIVWTLAVSVFPSTNPDLSSRVHVAMGVVAALLFFACVLLHEFGHALGAIHEHQHPEAGIPWNKEAVYRYYEETQGWGKEEVHAQIFNKYGKTSLNTSAYDRKSIMHYPVPKALTLGGFQIGWNRVLSSKDKSFMRQLYP